MHFPVSSAREECPARGRSLVREPASGPPPPRPTWLARRYTAPPATPQTPAANGRIAFERQPVAAAVASVQAAFVPTPALPEPQGTLARANHRAQRQRALAHVASVIEGRARVPANRLLSPDGSSFRQAIYGGAPILACEPPLPPAPTLFGQRWQFFRTLGEWPTLLERWALRSRTLVEEERRALASAVLYAVRWPSVGQYRALFPDRPFPHERSACLAYSESVGFADRPLSYDALARSLTALQALFAELPAGLPRASDWVESWWPFAAGGDIRGAMALAYVYSGEAQPVGDLDQELVDLRARASLPPEADAADGEGGGKYGDGDGDDGRKLPAQPA